MVAMKGDAVLFTADTSAVSSLTKGDMARPFGGPSHGASFAEQTTATGRPKEFKALRH